MPKPWPDPGMLTLFINLNRSPVIINIEPGFSSTWFIILNKTPINQKIIVKIDLISQKKPDLAGFIYFKKNKFISS